MVVTDEPHKYPKDAGFAQGVTVHHRDELDQIQLELREHPGVSVMVYDQTCASEKRRKRKKNTAEKTRLMVRAYRNGVSFSGRHASVASSCG